MYKYTKEDLINAAKQAYKKSGGMLSRKDFVRVTGIREWFIDNLFPTGGWSELSRLANIKSHSRQSKRARDRRLTLAKNILGKSKFLGI